MLEKFRKSLEEGYKKYLEVHPRSNEKIKPMHKCIAAILLEKLNNVNEDFEIKSLGIGDDKEYNFSGKYYSKNLDITILYKDNPISALGFKFITSNYKQNSNNYFEGMLGETANLKRNELLYGQILIFKHQMPYYSSDKKTFTKIEHINEENIKKYLKLYNDNVLNLYHKPDLLFIAFIETGDEELFLDVIEKNIEIDKKEFHKDLVKKVNVEFVNPDDLNDDDFSTEMKEFLKKIGNFEKFINAFVNLTKGKTYGI